MAQREDLFDGQVAVRAPLGAADLAGIPAKRGVFLLEGPGDQPILLATAADIRARMQFRLSAPPSAPGRRADLRELAVRLRWKLADSRFETDWRFLQLARAVHPRTYHELLSVKPPWFVRGTPGDEFPSLSVTNQVAGAGRFVGPFLTRHDARRFVEIIRDGFDLCRDEKILRRAPHGARCVYGQIGRCRLHCEGGISMAEYRRLFAVAWDYAGGDRQTVGREFADRMARLAEEMRYEAAGQVKSHLARLGELEAEDFRRAAPLERFQFILVQHGPSSAKAKVFLADRGAIAEGGVLDFPPQERRLAEVLSAMQGLTAGGEKGGTPLRSVPPRGSVPPRQARCAASADVEQLALVAHYLFAGPEKAGLAVRFDPSLTPAQLTGHVLAAAERLKLKAPKRAAKR